MTIQALLKKIFEWDIPMDAEVHFGDGKLGIVIKREFGEDCLVMENKE